MRMISSKYKFSGGVYAIVNSVNNKMYIGSTKDLYQRFLQHRKAMKNKTHHSFILNRAVNKYGLKNFKFVVLEDYKNNYTVDFLRDREQEWMDVFDTYNLNVGYNLSKTVNGVLMNSCMYDPLKKPVLCYGLDGKFIKEYESIADATRTLKVAVIQSLKDGGRAGNYMFKYKESDNFDLKIDEYVKFSWDGSRPKEVGDKISKALKGKPKSEEHKRKCSIAAKGSRRTEEFKKEQSNYFKQYYSIPEYKQQLLDMNKKAVLKSRKQVIQIDIHTKEKLNIFGSLKEASDHLNKGRNISPDISTCCKGRQETAHGYIWKYNNL